MKCKRRSQSEIRSILRAFRSSGLSQKKFCQQNKVPLATLGFWLRKERASVSNSSRKIKKTKPSFVPVPIPAGQLSFSLGVITVRLANDRIIEFPAHLQPDQLARFVSALENPSC